EATQIFALGGRRCRPGSGLGQRRHAILEAAQLLGHAVRLGLVLADAEGHGGSPVAIGSHEGVAGPAARDGEGEAEAGSRPGAGASAGSICLVSLASFRTARFDDVPGLSWSLMVVGSPMARP